MENRHNFIANLNKGIVLSYLQRIKVFVLHFVFYPLLKAKGRRGYSAAFCFSINLVFLASWRLDCLLRFGVATQQHLQKACRVCAAAIAAENGLGF